jgi:hypothetical protein
MGLTNTRPVLPGEVSFQEKAIQPDSSAADHEVGVL